MNKRIKIILIGFLLLILGPLVVPVPPVEGTVPVEELADSDSSFADLQDIRLHYKVYGRGDPVFVLLHGFGASTFSWRDVVVPLSRQGTVIVFDRPGFGLTRRPLTWEEENPYTREFSAGLVFSLMDYLKVKEAILVGHSAGGAVAVEAALSQPERVSALVLVAPAVEDRQPSWILKLPQVRHLGPLLVRVIARRGEAGIRQAWYDQAALSQRVIDGYKKPLQAENWDRGLWQYTLAAKPGNLLKRMESLQVPALVISGEDDLLVPFEASLAVAAKLEGSSTVVMPRTGHLPHEENPAGFIEAIQNWLDSIRLTSN